MEDFGSIEDDYIDLHTKSTTTEQKTYTALKCEPGWFLSIDKYDDDLDQPIIKFQADYHFVRGNFKEAINFYKKYISEHANISLTVKRECLEGLSRSYLSLNCFCYALKYANILEELCSTFDSYSTTYNLLLDCFVSAKHYKNALISCMKLVTLHCLNSDVWLKLGCIFGIIYKVPLIVSQLVKLNLLSTGEKTCSSKEYSLICECKSLEMSEYILSKDIQKGIHLIIVCLLHADFLLKSVIQSASGFAIKQNLDLQKGISKDIESFKLDSNNLKLLEENIKQQLGIKSKYEEEPFEKFDDKKNSQITSKEHMHYILEDFNIQEFERSWLLPDFNLSMSVN